MHFIPAKSTEQQSRLNVQRARKVYVEQRTALINRIRGPLSELGIVLPLKAATLRREAHRHLEDLSGWCNTADYHSHNTTSNACFLRSRMTGWGTTPNAMIEF